MNSILRKNNCQFEEQIALLHERVLRMYLQMYYKYKNFKIKNKGNEDQFHLFDSFFHDATGKINWEHLRTLMPQDLEKNIKNKYNMLSENEIRLSCLILFNVSVQEITDILPFTQNSIYVITNRIKRKTGMKDIKSSLKPFIVVFSTDFS